MLMLLGGQEEQDYVDSEEVILKMLMPIKAYLSIIYAMVVVPTMLHLVPVF